MYRRLFSTGVFALFVGGTAHATPLVPPALDRYPARFSLVLSPSEEINNGVNFFTQTGTPGGEFGLNWLLSSHPWSIPANEATDVGPSFDGNFVGVYKTFTSQHQTVLGTVGDPFQPSSLVVLLAEGTGLGREFNDVFGNGFSEMDIMDAMVRLRLGDTSGVQLLFEFTSGYLAQQPAYVAVGPDSFELAAAELVKFSVGTSAGEVISGSYRIPTPQPVPDSSIVIPGAIGIATLLGIAARIRRRQ